LSALATLSANVGNIQHAFCLGVRWGFGHSTGLLAVGIILILISRPSDNEDDTIDVPERLTTVFESLVGIFMIFLGVYGIRRAWIKRPKVYGIIPAAVESSQPESALPIHDVPDSFNCAVPAEMMQGESDDDDLEISRDGADSQTQLSLHFIYEWVLNLSTQTLAVLAGIIHGLAGPGGVLGVIPAVQLHNTWLAAVYLTSFCLSSTVTMGIFSMTYGSCSSHLVSGGELSLIPGTASVPRLREFRIESASASLSIVVGVLWLTLLSIGKLDDMFP
jgi:hypothetical protein